MRILTVRRCRPSLTILLALALPILLVLPASAATRAQVLNCSLPVGGTVTSIDAGSRTFEMTVTSNGVGVATVWVQKASVIVIREVDQQSQAVVAERPAGFADLRAGQRVAVQVMCLDDGRLVAISGAILFLTTGGTSTSASGSGSVSTPGGPGGPGGPGVPGGPGGPGGPGEPGNPIVVVTGTIVAKTGTTVTVGGKSTATVTIAIDGATRVRGQRGSLASLMLNDIVRIEAVKGSNGRLRARAITVLVVQVKTIFGTITAKGNGYIVVNGTQRILISADTLVLVNGTIKTVADLVVGAKVTVTAAIEPVKATVSGTVSGTAQVGTSTTQKTTETVKAVVIKVLKTVDP